MAKVNGNRETPEVLGFLRQRLRYDSRSGDFFWKSRPESDFASRAACLRWHGMFGGKKTGVATKLGYVVIGVTLQPRSRSVPFLAHRLAWAFVTGEWPEHWIDHKDGDPSNNTFLNLREATSQQNAWNKICQKNNELGLIGVQKFPVAGGFRYRASATRKNGKAVHLGMFSTPQEAVDRRNAFIMEERGGFAKTTH